MSVKNVVKVMNFHALLRVDSAKRNAEKYFLLETELSNMIDNIVNNRNFILDQKTLVLSDDKPALDIYIGSDFGFCSNYNSQVNNMLKQEEIQDNSHDKILIGKKIHYQGEHVLLRTTKEECVKDMEPLLTILERSIKKRQHREINIIYNHYQNSSTIHLDKKKVFPIELEKKDPSQYTDDFIVEGDINELLQSLITYYVIYELRICMVNAHAAENVLRQNTTSESLKKIDEREEITFRKTRKEKRAKEFRKIIENYTKKPAK